MSPRRAERTGRCLCGDVSYQVDGPFEPVLHCHCENCRRTSGNFVAASRASDGHLHIDDGARQLRWHDLGYASYGFCGRCGSTLFWKAADRAGTTSVMVGTLDDASGMKLQAVWFAAEAQPHNTIPGDVARFDGNA